MISSGGLIGMRPADRLVPPPAGPAADPVLYGVAEGLRAMFPAVLSSVADREPDQMEITAVLVRAERA